MVQKTKYLSRLGCSPFSFLQSPKAIFHLQTSLSVFLLASFLAVDVLQDHLLKTNARVSPKQDTVVSPRRPLHQHHLTDEAKAAHVKSGFIRNPLLVQAISRNQLFFFLLGNVLTGLVNLLVNTMQASDVTAMSILVVYLLFVNGVVVIFHVNDITTKFWQTTFRNQEYVRSKQSNSEINYAFKTFRYHLHQ